MAGRRKWIFHIAIMLNATLLLSEPQEAYGPLSISLHQGPGLSLTFIKDPWILTTLQVKSLENKVLYSFPNGS